MTAVNVTATRNLLELSRDMRIRYFCHLSSVGVIGRTRLKLVDESAACNPMNEYEATKLAAEEIVRGGLGDGRVVILRPTNIFGPATLRPMLQQSLRAQVRAFLKANECAHLVYIGDVVAAAMYWMQAAPAKSTETFIVSSDEESGNAHRDIQTFLASRVQTAPRPVKLSAPLFAPYCARLLRHGKTNYGDVLYSSSKIKQAGFNFPFGLKAGLDDALNALLQSGVARGDHRTQATSIAPIGTPEVRRRQRGFGVKVLNVIISLDRVKGGGSVERTFQMSRSLAKAGEECTILTTNIGVTPERMKELEGVTIVALPCLSQRFYLPKFNYKDIQDLVRKSDVIHLMSHWTFLNALVYFIAKRHNKPYVVCPAGVLLVYGRSKILKTLYNWVIGRRIIRNAAKHIAITADEIPQFGTYGVSKDSVTIIPNGIDPEEFKDDKVDDFRAKYGLGSVPFILFMGRLDPAKGPDLLLKAFCNAREHLLSYHLAFAGPDLDKSPELRAMVAHHNLENRVHFLGYVGGLDKSRAYHAADLLVIPSRREAMSIVVLEAGISGTPVLMTDQCGFNEIAEAGGGMVVPLEGLEKGLVDMLGNPASLKTKGEKLRAFVSKYFLWDTIIDKYIQLYNEVFRLEQRKKRE